MEKENLPIKNHIQLNPPSLRSVIGNSIVLFATTLCNLEIRIINLF